MKGYIYKALILIYLADSDNLPHDKQNYSHTLFSLPYILSYIFS